MVDNWFALFSEWSSKWLKQMEGQWVTVAYHYKTKYVFSGIDTMQLSTAFYF